MLSYNICPLWSRRLIKMKKYLNSWNQSFQRYCSSSTSNLSWKILFFGADEFSLESLRMLHETRVDKKNNLVTDLQIVTTVGKGKANLVTKYGENHNIVIHPWPYKVTKDQFDLGVVVSFGHLLPADLIAKFPWGIINVHASLLPRWRGAAPIVHALLNDDKVTGITIMKIDPHHFDTGKILLCKKHPIAKDATSTSLHRELSILGAEVLSESLENLPDLMKNSEAQDLSQVTKAPKPVEKMSLINWTNTQKTIERQYRALDAHFKLHYSWKDMTVRFTKMIPLATMNDLNINSLSRAKNIGRIYVHKPRNILCIRCKDGWVGFQEICIPGKKPMTASEFYNGYISKVEKREQIFVLKKKKI